MLYRGVVVLVSRSRRSVEVRVEGPDPWGRGWTGMEVGKRSEGGFPPLRKFMAKDVQAIKFDGVFRTILPGLLI